MRFHLIKVLCVLINAYDYLFNAAYKKKSQLSLKAAKQLAMVCVVAHNTARRYNKT